MTTYVAVLDSDHVDRGLDDMKYYTFKVYHVEYVVHLHVPTKHQQHKVGLYTILQVQILMQDK